MATKSKLEQAIERQMDGMNDAQREIVRSQLSEYRSNKARLAEIAAEMRAVNATPAVTREAVREKQARRASLAYEHGQLSATNSKLASDLFGLLKE